MNRIIVHFLFILLLVWCSSCGLQKGVTLRSTDYTNEDIIPHIEDAIRAGAKTIFLTKGDYSVRSLLEIENQDDISIKGRNARLLLTKLPGEPGPAIIKVYQSDHLTITKLHIDGNRNRIETPRLLHSIFIYNSKEVLLKKLRIQNNLGDGIQIASNVNSKKDWSENILIQDCHVNNSGRNGLSIINMRNLKVINSSFNNSNGEAPQAGIDVEPDEDKVRPGVTNVLFKKINVVGNKGNGIAIPHTGSPQDIRIHDSTISGNLGGIWTCGVYMSIERCNIISNRTYGISSIRYPEYNIPPDSIRIYKNQIQDNQLGIYYQGQGGVISNNRILNTKDEGIEIRKHHKEEHSATIKDNYIGEIAGGSAISSDFDKVSITGNRIENCAENGLSLHNGINRVLDNSISSCDGYSILVNDAYCEISNNRISDGDKYLIWFNAFGHKNTGGKLTNNVLIETNQREESLIYDTSGNIDTYRGNKIRIPGNKSGTVILKKKPLNFNDKEKAVQIRD